MKPAPSITELEKLTGPYISPAVAALYYRCDPQYIRVAARQHHPLPFPTELRGTRILIPRLEFIRWYRTMTEEATKT